VVLDLTGTWRLGAGTRGRPGRRRAIAGHLPGAAGEPAHIGVRAPVCLRGARSLLISRGTLIGDSRSSPICHEPGSSAPGATCATSFACEAGATCYETGDATAICVALCSDTISCDLERSVDAVVRITREARAA